MVDLVVAEPHSQPRPPVAGGPVVELEHLGRGLAGLRGIGREDHLLLDVEPGVGPMTLRAIAV